MNKFKIVSKDDCGVFAVLRKKNSNKISSSIAINGIECVRFRGSKYGAGFACFNLDNGFTNDYYLQVFVADKNIANEIKNILQDSNIIIKQENLRNISAIQLPLSYNLIISADNSLHLAKTIHDINSKFSQPEYSARVYSSGNYLEVYKDIGYPLDVAKSTGLIINNSNGTISKLKNIFGYRQKEKMGDLWLAHTRQPTNSPGSSATWSHPFSFFNTAIVHNGDISSFGANINFLNSRGIPNLVGTDSEVVSFIIDYLVRVMKLSMEEIGLILSNPYDRFLYRMGKDKSKKIRDLLYKYQGSQLDGPFTILAGYSDGEDVYLLSIIDRSKFRPIVIGEDQNYIYMASEECQIRLLSPNSIIWTPEPGKFVLASMNHGIIESGRTSEIIVNSASKNELIQIQKITHSSKNMINAVDLSSYELNRQIKIKLSDNEKSITLLNVRGQRYLGVDLPKGTKLHIYGTPGNCLANFNKGTEICVYGSAEDNVADTMYEGKIIIHGDSRDVIGYALQGGKIFVKGNVGNRAFILMREYEESRPVVIVGGRADDYFGEYMAGGLAMVLGIDSIDSVNEEQLVGNFLATGMLRGSIYIRGKINSDSIGLKPPIQDIIRYLEYLNSKGIITDVLFKKISSSSDINLEILKELLPENAFYFIKKLFLSKYSVKLSIEYRKLNDFDRKIIEPNLKEFVSCFNLSSEIHNKILNSHYTIISSIDKSKELQSPTVNEIEE